MDIAGIQSGLVGFALFDAWYNAIKKSHKCDKGFAPGHRGSPLVAAAANAFESYIAATETAYAAQIAALAPQALAPTGEGAALAASIMGTGGGPSIYNLSPNGQLITQSQMAPFLALNLLA